MSLFEFSLSVKNIPGVDIMQPVSEIQGLKLAPLLFSQCLRVCY